MTMAVAENLLASSGGDISENCGPPPSKEGSTTEVAVGSGSNDYGDNGDVRSPLCHDLWRIALYYIYIEMTPVQVESHINLQRQVCEELGLYGRIRVSQEGVNGVLSGKYEVLRIYEKRISCALQTMLKGEEEILAYTTGESEEEDVVAIVDLDVKYCDLRAELPVEKQLFDRLIVKKTKNVIGLFDQSIGQERQRQQQKLLKSERLRRRRERKRQEQEAKRQTKIDDQHQIDAKQSQSSTTPSIPPNDKILIENDSDEFVKKGIAPPASASGSLDMSSLYQSVMEEPLNPAQHLTGNEWNEKLDAVATSDKSALLLDVRNVYEMKVGHFVHPSTPTLLTNTRKYSDLPMMLASSKEMQERDQIFMYCTGGVRCERVSMLVRELYPEKEIFQLQGGIQRYLETCSEQKQQQKQQKDDNTDSTNLNPGYFVGKNFVFDPRRTDPTHFGETVGRCLVCQRPHDDYDNGHAPSENKEARCNNCRMLILICNDCRPKYRCHGETQNQYDSFVRPLLYCNVDTCIHEGSTPDPELLVAAKEGRPESCVES